MRTEKKRYNELKKPTKEQIKNGKIGEFFGWKDEHKGGTIFLCLTADEYIVISEEKETVKYRKDEFPLIETGLDVLIKEYEIKE